MAVVLYVVVDDVFSSVLRTVLVIVVKPVDVQEVARGRRGPAGLDSSARSACAAWSK